MYYSANVIERLQHLCNNIEYTNKKDIVAIVQDILKDLDKKRQKHLNAVKKYYRTHKEKYYEIQKECYAKDPEKRKKQQNKAQKKFKKKMSSLG